ncbi:MAG: translation initiation factor IF-2 N-terminal domain-containing protein [Planctomycetes bacterium]|nr:translation initiation factor IF-2 N-terminal domain-containing protein [Planctomycetota bacterium]
MTKVRVYELAKEYGLKGPELAKELKELGFAAIKSHMAVLDDAQQLQVRAVIETQLLTQRSAAATPVVEAEPARTEAPGLKRKALPGSAPTPTGTGEAVAAEPSRKPLPDKLERKRLPEPLRKEAPKPAPQKRRGDEQPEATPTREATPAPREIAEESHEASVATPTPTPQETTAARETPSMRELPPREHGPREVPQPKEPRVETVAMPPAASAVVDAPRETTSPEPEAAEAVVGEDVGVRPIESEETLAASAQVSETTAVRHPARKHEASPDAAPIPTEPTVPIGPTVKRLLVPEAKAKVLGRIELPPEAIRDAQRRSAPAQARNPGNVDRNLRQAALRSTQSRSAAPRGRPAPGAQSGARRGPAPTSGPSGRPRPGGRGGKRGGGGLSSTSRSRRSPRRSA